MTKKSNRKTSNPSSKASGYHIRGTRTTPRPREKRLTPIHPATKIRSRELELRCAQCLNTREPGSFPICDDCQARNRRTRGGK